MPCVPQNSHAAAAVRAVRCFFRRQGEAEREILLKEMPYRSVRQASKSVSVPELRQAFSQETVRVGIDFLSEEILLARMRL